VPGAHAIVTYLITALTAVSAWLSLGMMAVSSADTRMRVFVFAPVWLLPVLAAIAIAAAWYFKPAASRLLPLLLTLLLWLPYVPGQVPAAFLIWQGPIEIGVWIFALAGFFRDYQPRYFKAAPLVAAIAAAALYAAGAMALRDHLPIGDEPHYLMMTQSLIKDGDLRIENNHQDRDYASFASFDIPMHYLTRGTDGQIYSVHAPGVAVVVLPAFAVFGYYGGVATVILLVALASAIGWHAAWLLTASAPAAWLAWAAVFLTAPIFLQAVTVFPDAVGALPVMAGVWLLIAIEVNHPFGNRLLLSVSAALAVLPWLHSRFALLAGGLGIAISLRLIRSDWRRVVPFLAIPAVSAALWFGFFWWFWGSPSPAAPWGSGITSRLEWIPRGMRGLLADPQAGLLIPAPAYVGALIGWVLLARTRPRLAIETTLIAIALAASVASYETWWGGQGAPARYLVAALPLCIVPFATFSARGRFWRLTGAAAVLLSLLLLTAKVTAQNGAFAFNPEIIVNPVFGWMSPAVEITSLRVTPVASQLAFMKSWDGRAVAGSPSDVIQLHDAGEGMQLGAFRVFLLDHRAYAEPTGFWVAAGSETTVIVDGADGGRNLGVRLRAGPVSTTASIAIGDERQDFTFAAGQRHETAIPPMSIGAWKITIRTGAGFRPRDFDAQAGDARHLGIWVEVF
jgi:hypothetical protein